MNPVVHSEHTAGSTVFVELKGQMEQSAMFLEPGGEIEESAHAIESPSFGQYMLGSHRVHCDEGICWVLSKLRSSVVKSLS